MVNAECAEWLNFLCASLSKVIKKPFQVEDFPQGNSRNTAALKRGVEKRRNKKGPKCEEADCVLHRRWRRYFV